MKKLLFSFTIVFFSYLITQAQIITNWVVLASGTTENLRSVFFTDSLNGHIIGQNNLYLSTTDGGETWKSSSLPEQATSIFFFNKTLGFCSALSGKILKTTNQGNSWTVLTTPFFGNFNDIFFIDANTGFAVGDSSKILKTTNGGSSWSVKYSDSSSVLVSIDFADLTVGYACGTNNLILRTTDAGETWLKLPAPGGTDNSDLSFNNFYTGVVITQQTNGSTINKTVDGGFGWTTQLTTPSKLLSIQMINDTLGYACGLNAAMYKTVDGGNTWLPEDLKMTRNTEDLYSFFAPDVNFGITIGNKATIMRKTKAVHTSTFEMLNISDTLKFLDQNVVMKFDTAYITHPDSMCVCATQFKCSALHSPCGNDIATVFNHEYWHFYSGIRYFKTGVCLYIDPSDFNLTRLDNLNVVYQENYGDEWTSLKVDNLIYNKELCFKTDHFSNWSIALTKPEARMAIDTVWGNSFAQPKWISANYSQSNVELNLKLNSNSIDTVEFHRYDINPGGDLPLDFTGFLGTFWELKRSQIDTTFLYIDPSGIEGYNPDSIANYHILYRADPVTDWTGLPTMRVKKGLKEALFVKSYNPSNQIALGKSTQVTSLFSVSVSVSPSLPCAGWATFFTSSITGGTPPYKFQWSGDDNVSSNDSTFIHIYGNGGVFKHYKLEVTDSNKAVTTFEDSVFVEICANISPIQNHGNDIVIYPDPVENNIFNVKMLNLSISESIQLKITNTLGETILKKRFNNQSILRVEVPFASSGIYMLELNDGKKIINKKLMVVK